MTEPPSGSHGDLQTVEFLSGLEGWGGPTRTGEYDGAKNARWGGPEHVGGANGDGQNDEKGGFDYSVIGQPRAVGGGEYVHHGHADGGSKLGGVLTRQQFEVDGGGW